MDTGCVMVWTTVASTAEGERVASILVEERLAACVNVLGEMQSFYRWKGSVEMGRGAAARHQDHRRARARAHGAAAVSCMNTIFRSSSSCRLPEAATRTLTGFESRPPSDIIAPFLPSGLRRSRLSCSSGSLAPDQAVLDRGINFAIIVLAAVSIYRVTRLARAGLLWGVSRKLILSYILVGAVPILLLATFSFVAFLLVFFDVSSYLVQNRIAELTEQAATLARTTLAEAETSPNSRHEAIVNRREATAQPSYPGIKIAIVPADTLPPWVPSQGFAGLTNEGQLARGVAVGSAGAPRHAVIVDLPVEGAMRASGLPDAGVRLGESPMSIFRTATFFSYVDWPSGAATRTRDRRWGSTS